MCDAESAGTVTGIFGTLHTNVISAKKPDEMKKGLCEYRGKWSVAVCNNIQPSYEIL